jgi:molybdopterin-guanine dinucleotide biosynthesis protein A
MGGKAKGLLLGPGGESIVGRWMRIFGQLGIAHVLVGKHPAYASFGIRAIADDVRAPGPLGGLLALLDDANSCGVTHVIAVACDMAHVSETLVRKLMEASPAPIVAPRTPGAPRESAFWQPLFARYDVGAVLPVARAWAADQKPSLQGFLNACGASELPLDADQFGELRDWDAPEDIDFV